MGIQIQIQLDQGEIDHLKLFQKLVILAIHRPFGFRLHPGRTDVFMHVMRGGPAIFMHVVGGTDVFMGVMGGMAFSWCA